MSTVSEHIHSKEIMDVGKPKQQSVKIKSRKTTRRPLYTWGSVIVGLALWQLIGTTVVKNSLFLATPVQSILAIVQLWNSGELLKHMILSGQEFIYGFVIASIVGVIVGLFTASFERISLVANPWIYGFYATPLIALAPLLILWFGIGIWSKVAVVICLVFFPVAINTNAGVKNTDAHLIEAIRSFGASRLQIFIKVSLPGALPLILTGLRLGVGRGLLGVVVGELAGSRGGLGYLINNAGLIFDLPQLFAGVIVLAVSGILLTTAFHKLESILVPWKEDK
jgi:NitT/TauT family transport system permease protein